MAVPHLLDTYALSTSEIVSIVSEAHSYVSPDGLRPDSYDVLAGRRIILAFFEASTRTRLSFETAAHRLGAATLLFQPAGSSVEKGETLRETFLTIEAMSFDAMVLRHGADGAHTELAAFARMPIINAGEGSRAHPTQALLDASALMERCGDLHGKRICIVGDIRHSRVARSNVDVFRKLGAEVAICGPASLMPTDPAYDGITHVPTIDDAIAWADVVNLLRIQRERISSDVMPSIDTYRALYAMTTERMRNAGDLIVTHPGPVNLGVEIDADVLDDPRSLIHRQVTHGVAVRMAVLRRILTPVRHAYAL